jgi:predicted dehydrogenase
MESLRLLVVGHGLIGSQRAAAAHAMEKRLPVRLAATVDPVERPHDLYGGAPHHRDLSEVEPDSYDVGVVALPHQLAVDAARLLLAADKPILIEKPLGLTAATAGELEAAAAQLERPSFVGYNYRFLPHVGELLRLAEGGGLGELRSIEMLIGHGGNPDSAKGWKLRPDQGGGGVIMDPGVHLLDLLLLLDPDVTLSHVDGTRGFWETGIEEDAVMVFRDERLLASLRASHIRWVNEMRIEVVGTDGYALLTGRGGTYGPMTFRRGERWAWRDDPGGRAQRETEDVHDFGSENRSLEDELEAVVMLWLSGGPPQDGPGPARMAEARRVTELADDLYKRLPA